MPPRGLKAFVTSTAPGKLTKGKFKGYRAVDANGAFEGPTLKGITKKLVEKLFSNGDLDEAAVSATEWTPDAWKGAGGGLRRGKAVDSQVSRLAASTATARSAATKYKYTSLAFSALERAGLEPLAGQRVVLSRAHGIATAADVVCYRKDNSLVLVELKCGFSGNRTLAAVLKNKIQHLRAPCAGATDCILNRHMAQLATTHRLLVTEPRFASQLKFKFGLTKINGALLYVCDRDTQLYELTPWWTKRGKALVELLGSP